MAQCSPLDTSIPLPDGPSGPAIKGFGIPFATNLPNINTFPFGAPEDLMNLMNQLQLLIPPGTLQPSLNPNFGKDVFDGIMKLLDQFMPFLMMYKFFLPVLNLITCIIEVLCAIPNPWKLVKALTRLFRDCLPPFLNLFPQFAMIASMISMLVLIIALVEYLIQQVIKLVKTILRNILALQSAIKANNTNSILAIAKKIGSLLCMFQNMFVLLAIIGIIIQIIKDILGVPISIPPCDSSGSGGNSNTLGEDGCCTTTVCPGIVKTNYTKTTGTLKYLNTVKVLVPSATPLPAPFNSMMNIVARQESWQLFDTNQNISEQFANIIDAYDVTIIPKPIFFPTDSIYDYNTPVRQAAYTVDLRLFYNPANWNRIDVPRYIRFKDCIVSKTPTKYYKNYDNTEYLLSSGVLNITGGYAYEDDGTTQILGYESDGITRSVSHAQLNTFLHTVDIVSAMPSFSSADGYTYNDVIEYTFKPNIPVLVGKNIITAGCSPDLDLNKVFINSAFAGDMGLKALELNNLINSNKFPNPNQTIECLNTALAALRLDLTEEGLAKFQAIAEVCLNKLNDDAKNSLIDLIGLGFEPCNSTFTINPQSQFTTKPIKIKVELRERNNLSLTMKLPVSVATGLSKRFKAYTTFGETSKFMYDGYQYFESDLTSDIAGSGNLMISFDNNIFCTNNIPSDVTQPPTHILQSLPYQFIYTSQTVPVGTGDQSDGTPRRSNE